MNDRRKRPDRRCRLSRHGVSKTDIIPLIVAAFVVLLVVGHAIKGANVASAYVEQQMAPIQSQPES